MTPIKKYRIFVLIFVLAFSTSIKGISQIKVTGFVHDLETGENLIGANILIAGSQNGTTTDNQGFFSIKVNAPVTLEISFIGYQTGKVKIDSEADTLIHFGLKPGENIEKVVVSPRNQKIKHQLKMNTAELQRLPSLGAKPDVIKAMSLNPGIQMQQEGSSVLQVRGGDPGQNLYLLDDVPLIYIHHLGGFTSVFNPDIINSLDVYKDNFPAYYGGKLSSVISITQREGDMSKTKGSASLGLTDFSFTAEGPTKINNSSFIITGRKTFFDVFPLLYTKFDANNEYIYTYGFHDINGKFTWRADENNSFHLNFYQGDDYINFWSDEDYQPEMNHHLINIWGNLMGSARWMHAFSSGLLSTNTLSFTRYRLRDQQEGILKKETGKTTFSKKYVSAVSDLSLRSKWKYQWGEEAQTVFGFQSSLFFHQPNKVTHSFMSDRTNEKVIISGETALYMDNTLKVTRFLQGTFGARMVHYNKESYQKFFIEPRLTLDFKIAGKDALYLGYMQTNQYNHLLFTKGNIMNNEIWFPAGKSIKPSKATQFSAGLTGSFFNGLIHGTFNTYYKDMNRLTTYPEGYESIPGDMTWESKIITGGTGKAYGMEFNLAKKTGKWQGHLAYTYSNTTRQYDEINNGKAYVYEFDRPHVGKLSLRHQFNNKIGLSMVWNVQSGLPYTPAIGRQYAINVNAGSTENKYYETLIYGERNSRRMKLYHRMDLALKYTTETKRGNKALWTFSLYNVYNKHNPVFYYYNDDNSDQMYRPEYRKDFKPLKLYQVSFFPFIPTVSYKVYFNGNSNKKEESFMERLRKWLYYE